MVKACIYLRVSTKEQDVGSQKVVIEDYCLKNQIEIYKTMVFLEQKNRGLNWTIY